MTRKDYVLIAAALRKSKPAQVDARSSRAKCYGEAVATWAGCVSATAAALAADNPLFDSERFLAACGVEA